MMMFRRKNLIKALLILGIFPFSGFAQESRENSVSISAEEGMYIISFPDGDIVETTFAVEDSLNIKTIRTDTLLINFGTASEITLRTVPVSDTLNIGLRGLELNVVKNPFSIKYQFNEAWYDLESGKKFTSGSSHNVSNKEAMLSTVVRGGSLVPSVKTERDELWQVHYFYEQEEKERKRKFCPEDFKAPAGEECIEVSYEISGKEIIFKINATSSKPTIDEVELVLHGLENRIEFVWLNNIKYTPKNFLHEGKQFIPLRFDSQENTLRLELK